MSRKILVTTDYSLNSKAGIRFAIQLASQQSLSLIFLHVIELLIPARWNEVKAKIHSDETIKDEKARLQSFVKDVYKESNIRPTRFECVVRYGAPVSRAIMEYAQERKARFICIGTRGAGRLRRIIGTHTSAIIKHSPIPVFAIPKNYRRTPISHVMYVSDFRNIRKELSIVKRFAAAVKSKISVIHYDYFVQIKDVRNEFEKYSIEYESPNVKFYLQKFDWEGSLAAHIKKAITKFKPSVISLFSKKPRNWYQRIFLFSESADISYDTKKPLLVFPK